MKGTSIALIGIVCLLAGAIAGALFGSGVALPAPPATAPALTDGTVAAALADLAARIERLERAIRSQPVPGERREVATAANLSSAPGNDLEAVLQRLSALAERLASVPTGSADAALRLARIQRPDPDLGALTALHQALQDEDAQANVDPSRSVRRPWLLDTPAEVIQKLGTPNKIEPSSGSFDMLWTYTLPADGAVEVYLRNGLVVMLDVR